MSTERWQFSTLGVGSNWTALFNSADVNSLANGSSVLSSAGDIANGDSPGDMYMDIDFLLASVTTVAPNKLDFFFYPLNQDGNTYGDNQLTAGSQAAVTPSASLYVATFILPVGTQALKGMLQGIVMPIGTFRPAMQNNAGVTLGAGSGNSPGEQNFIYYRTYNRQIA